ncbi:F510_1955 family glycosylhydrolase [Halobacillus mangrovi]|uniref:F510_1955 family glycosylhydrolase n=1 Tax=Halobacillus mangrovi TaxID=402384 RepID=UPI003D976425
MKKILFISFLIVIIILAGCSQSNQEESGDQPSDQEQSANEATSSFEGSLEHVHGVGYTNEDTIAYAAHSGVKLYKNGEWLEAVHHKNDYMGFTVVEDGFYTSGHPGQQSSLPNPIGLQKGKVSEEGLSSLAFEGESDFHAMGVGYRNQAVYVLNGQPNSKMEKGLYRSFDQGKSWDKLAAENLGEKIFQIAVHPDNEKILAIAGAEGIYLSEDKGESFTRISDQGQGSGLFFTKDRLLYGLYTGEPFLYSYQLEEQSKQEISLPELKEDAVMYVSKHPENEKEIVIFTIKGSSYTTSDGGESWKQIIDQGKTK